MADIERPKVRPREPSAVRRIDVAELLSDIDRAILGQLTRDPFASARTLAEVLEMPHSLVTSRLRALDRRNVSHVVAVLDMKRLGQSFCLVQIDLDGELKPELLQQLIAMRETMMVSELIGGRADLLVIVRFSNFLQLNDLLYGKMAHLLGMGRWQVDVVLDVPVFRSEYVTMATNFLDVDIDRNIEDLQHDLPPGLCDELDVKLIAYLQNSARRSLNDVARTLEIGASTLRYRVNALEASGILRFKTVIDDRALGLGAFAMVELEVDVSSIETVVDKLRKHPALRQVFVCAGVNAIVGMLSASSESEILRIKQAELARIPGVHSVKATPFHRTHKIDFRWAQEVH
jgi:DNA-binding Lrp family transcriptional regulator